MLLYPHIDPVALAIGPIKIHWYGLMYVIGIAATWYLARRRVTAMSKPPCSADQVEDLIFYVALGLVLGGRLGYTLFYNLNAFLADPLIIVRIWEGGMSFHGGLVGGVVGGWLYSRKMGVNLLSLTDLIFPFVPIGLFAGRLGNFINAELWGVVTELPWGMVFPGGGPLPRHPTQLYEAIGEGLILGLLMFYLSKFHLRNGVITGAFFLGYAVVRFTIEFVRSPDPQIGYLLGNWFTMGQLLTLPVAGLGLWLILQPQDKKH